MPLKTFAAKDFVLFVWKCVVCSRKNRTNEGTWTPVGFSPVESRRVAVSLAICAHFLQVLSMS